MKYIEIKSPAKINIGLDIISKRADGYHNLQTIFYPLCDLYDTIIIEKANEFSFTSSLESINDNQNLIVKAKNLLEKYFSKKFNVKIHLEKNIPLGAGLGGGSSNAASILLSLNDMFNLGMTKEVLIKYALELGSDVPFFIKVRPSIGTGRGEILSEIDFEFEKPILVINPGIHISTKEAFANIIPKQPLIDFKNIPSLSMNFPKNYNSFFKNDFEEYVFRAHKEVAEIKNKMINNGALFSLMSGSGSTVYGIFENLKDAEKAKSEFSSSYFSFIHE